MNKMKFYKAQTNGNDFVIIEANGNTLSLSQKKLIADRKHGIGCDQIIFVTQKNGRYCLDFYNQDGTHANMCGNGSCATALFIKNKYGLVCTEFEVFQDAEHIPVKVGSLGEPAQAYLDRFRWRDVVKSRAYHIAPPENIYKAKILENDVSIEFPLPLQEGNIITTGNKHLILEMSEIDKVNEFSRLNPDCNIHFVKQLSSDTLRVKTFEKGVGWTLACGSGAVATGYHSKIQGKINIIHDGGKSVVEIKKSHVSLTTAPRIVYEGEFYE